MSICLFVCLSVYLSVSNFTSNSEEAFFRWPNGSNKGKRDEMQKYEFIYKLVTNIWPLPFLLKDDVFNSF